MKSILAQLARPEPFLVRLGLCQTHRQKSDPSNSSSKTKDSIDELLHLQHLSPHLRFQKSDYRLLSLCPFCHSLESRFDSRIKHLRCFLPFSKSLPAQGKRKCCHIQFAHRNLLRESLLWHYRRYLPQLCIQVMYPQYHSNW